MGGCFRTLHNNRVSLYTGIRNSSEMAATIWLTVCTVCTLYSAYAVNINPELNPGQHHCAWNKSPQGCVFVDCRKRNLTSIPLTLPNTTCALMAQHNRITLLTAEQLKPYPSLLNLSLANNAIRSIDQDAFTGVGELLALYLDNNNISITNVHSGMFKPLRKLKVLTLHNNKLSDYLDEVLGDLISLQTLQMDGFPHQILGAGYSNLTRLQCLTLSGDSGRCDIGSQSNKTFENVRRLKMLNIASCGIKFVDAGAFTPLKRIEVIDMSRNQALGLDSLRNITYGCKYSPIKILFLNKIKHTHKTCNIISSRDIEFLQNTSISEIHANSNRLSGFSPDALEKLPKTLKKVYLLDNRLSEGPYINKLETLTGLEELYLNGKAMEHYLVFGILLRSLTSSKESVVPPDSSFIEDVHHCCMDKARQYSSEPIKALHTLESGVQCIATDGNVTLNVPPNLRNISYTYSELAFVLSEIHFSVNNLLMINISNNVLTVWQGPIYGLSSLTSLYLSNNIAHHVSKVFFSQMTSLVYLDISSNFLGHCIEYDTNGEIFGNLSSLQYLNLSLNRVHFLPNKIFKGLTSLQTLDLSQNVLGNFDHAFSFSEKLTLLKADRNQIKCPSLDDLSQFDNISHNHSLEVDLSTNPFICSCDLLPFLQWLSNTCVVMINRNNYTCMYSNRNISLDEDILKDTLNKDCNPVQEHFGLAMGTVAGLIFLLTVISGGIAYRYRWKLSYWYYAAKLRMKAPSAETLDYDYDAFVSYADENRSFILEDMIPKLEIESGLRLCIHNRDFLPGKPIAENIIDAIQRSRKTLLILSNDFLESTWCRYELQMANMEQVSSGRDVLLIVMLEELPSRKIPPELMYHIHNQTYLEYPHHDQKNIFWTTLSLSIKTD